VTEDSAEDLRLRFGELVAHRRAELGLAQNALQQAGGPSGVTVRDIEAGRVVKPSRITLAKLDRALRWKAGSAIRSLSGGDPTPLPRETVGPGADAAAFVATGSGGDAGLTDDEVLALIRENRRLADELERRIKRDREGP